MNVWGGGEDISQIIIIRNAIIEANKEASVKGIVRSHALLWCFNILSQDK